MSTIGVTHHRESIYRILYKEPPPRPKSPMYISEREKLLKCQIDCIPKTYCTMGPAEEILKAPCQYLRKGGGIRKKEQNITKECCMKNIHNKTTSSGKTTKEKPEEKSKKKTGNAKNKVDAMIRNKKPKNITYVDTVTGHKCNLIKNKWIYSEGYGVIPEYIINRKQEWYRAEEEYRRELESQEPLCKPVSVKERQEVLDGLKYNHRQLQRDYLLLPMMIDTIPKVNRKTKLENDLRQMEKDVRLIEENPYIYIYD